MSTSTLLQLLLIIYLCMICGNSWAEERYALLIGNSDYKQAPLDNAANDAHDVALELRNLGFKTELLIDASVDKMRSAITEFYTQLDSRKAVSVFYYAGHAMQAGSVNFLIPIDANITDLNSLSTEAVDMNFLLRQLHNARSRTNIMILDACRNNPFSHLGGRGLAAIDAPPGTFIAYSTEPGQVAQDGTGKNGTYTKYLLKYLDEPVGIEKMFKFVRASVMRETGNQQIPWEHSSLYRDFHFRKDVASEMPSIPSF